MSLRVRGSPPARARRSHAERTAETRERVMTAVIESIAEIGYQRTTAAEIARRAGVTWGAVQHHFGDKDGILVAVLEASFDRFAALLASPPPEDASLTARVDLFVERSWQHFSGPHYRSTFEILLNLPMDLDLSWRRDVLDTWNDLWSQYFPHSRLSRRKTLELMHYAVSVLSGLAATPMLEGTAAPGSQRELRFLRDTLQRELGGESSAS